MKESPFIADIPEEEQSLISMEMLLKYLRYWPLFLIAALLSLFLGYAYARYAAVIYVSTAKIKIIDDSSELDIAKDPLAQAWSGSKINMDNEIEIIKSYRLLDQVVTDLNLDIEYYGVGSIKTSQIWNPPFEVAQLIQNDSLTRPLSFFVELNTSGFNITDENDKVYTVPFEQQNSPIHGLPFSIKLSENSKANTHKDRKYLIMMYPRKEAVLQLISSLQVQPSSKKSDILTLWLVDESPARSEAILNTAIEKFNQDGILDRQSISKRTLDFIDERFMLLSGELDSIEVGKQDFKQVSSLAYIEDDATSILKRKSIAEDGVFDLETQISLAKLLKETVMNEASYSLLPSDIGLSSSSINTLVTKYNELALQRSKLLSSVGESHPQLKQLSDQLEREKINILKTISIYQSQLNTSLNQLTQERNLAGSMFSRLPEKEKMLRSIDRQQDIKEKLFLLLLQKREEAAINHAVTAPSIKVVDYGLTYPKPESPKKTIIYPLALMLGFLVPFVILFIRFSLDNKIHDRSDIVKLNTGIPVVAEIPLLKETENFIGANDRSIIAESFRILSTNVSYLLPEKELKQGQIIFVTSAIKGEGKTLMAYNLSLAYASIKKKVLLVGADLRNPALKNYFEEKKIRGLSDYLSDPEIDWQECIHEGLNKNEYHKVSFGGTIPPNPPELLAGEGFGKFMAKAKKEFDYIIVDTAPTLLVTDTMLISKYADVTLFVTRANFTDKKLLAFSKDLNANNKLKNMAYVVNGVGNGKSKDYNYGYGYGYGSEQ